MADVVNTNMTVFQIRELTGDQRILRLRNRALPYRPLELSGTMRHTIDWYPGSPEGTLQVYGAKEEMTVIQGAWKDKFLHAETTGAPSAAQLQSTGVELDKDIGEEIGVIIGQSLVTVQALVRTCDDFRRKGQEVEVTWMDQVRVGIIDRFTAKWLTPHDCEWEMAFDWTGQGDRVSEVPLDSNHSDLGDLPAKVQSKINDVVDEKASALPQAGDRAADVSDKLTELGNKLQELSDELVDNVQVVSSALTLPNDALRRAVGILDGIKLTAEECCGIAEETADGIALDSGTVNTLNAVAKSFGEILFQRGKLRERSRAAVSLRNLAAQQQVAMIESLDATVIRVLTARQDQDLRDVSRLAYGTPDEWQGLMMYNGFKSSKLDAGQVVFIPASPPDRSC